MDEGVFVTVSNLAFLLPFAVGINRRAYFASFWVLFTGIVSAIYHACEARLGCWFLLDDLYQMDLFMSAALIPIAILTLANLHAFVRLVVQAAFGIAAGLLASYGLTSAWMWVASASLSLFVVFLTHCMPMLCGRHVYYTELSRIQRPLPPTGRHHRRHRQEAWMDYRFNRVPVAVQGAVVRMKVDPSVPDDDSVELREGRTPEDYRHEEQLLVPVVMDENERCCEFWVPLWHNNLRREREALHIGVMVSGLLCLVVGVIMFAWSQNPRAFSQNLSVFVSHGLWHVFIALAIAQLFWALLVPDPKDLYRSL